mgnify:FL=1
MVIKHRVLYAGDIFPSMSIAALLNKVKVSEVRPIPCTIEGKVLGRGIAGYIFSEDFIVRDETGILYADYQQPLAIWEFFFGLLKAGDYKGCDVTIKGWYRRSPVPYIQIYKIDCYGEVRKSWASAGYLTWAIILAVIGVLLCLLNEKYLDDIPRVLF